LFGGVEIKLSVIMLVNATTKLSKQVNETLLAKTDKLKRRLALYL
jgi:hypothetical protein